MGLKTNNYFGRTAEMHSHGEPLRIGVLLTNVGTPDAPTYFALRRYLKQFLADPRVIELNKWFWWVILNVFILTFRPQKSAAKYRAIWTKKGSPLLVISEEQKEKLANRLKEKFHDRLIVEIGMGYGNPSIGSAIKELVSRNVDRLLVLPLFPQYSSPTTGSTFDGVSSALKGIRAVPELRFLTHYHDEPGYIQALTRSINELWARDGKPDKLVFSFHGIPMRYFLNGDPYFCHCQKTARLVTEALGLEKDQFLVCFQSLFGKEEWLKPYTITSLEDLARSGVEKVDVICPGFSADCLETLEEIEVENKDAFFAAGGKRFRYIPALNASGDFINFLAGFVEKNLDGWLEDDAQERLAQARKLGAS